MTQESDLEELKRKVAAIKVECVDMQIMLSKYKPADLKNCGYKSVEEALKDTLERHQKSIKKLTDEFLKKYPD